MTGELGAHLWQSTCFAIAAGLLTLAFRQNDAQVRYWLWFTASCKFFIPFSLLIGVGNHLGWAPSAKKFVTPELSFAIERIARPFPEPLSFSPAAPETTHWIPIAMFCVWACGLMALLLIRLRGWLRIRAAVRAGVAMEIPAEVEVRTAPGLLEPGVVGLLRPILLLPEGIADRLTPQELEAVLAHELCHVSRHDNLFASIHMIVEAIFWFHPLVWWIGSRLLEERERACDEQVLNLGCDPRIYAGAILTVCKLHVESPLVCVAGVTGSNLKRRIEAIMVNRPALKLNLAKKAALLLAGMATLAAPVVVGAMAQSSDTTDWQTAAGGKRTFDSATVKRLAGKPRLPNMPLNAGDEKPSDGRFSATFPLYAYINFAYKIFYTDEQKQALAAWDWVLDDHFDIEAQTQGNPTKDEMRLMMQSLLADRFKLAAHFETREIPVFALTLAEPGKTGPKPSAFRGPALSSIRFTLATIPTAQGRHRLSAPRVSVGLRHRRLAEKRCAAGRRPEHHHAAARRHDLPLAKNDLEVDKPVVDQTGLNGKFDFTIEEDPPPPASEGTPFLTAVRQQLGLKLVPSHGPLRLLVIDHIENPSAK